LVSYIPDSLFNIAKELYKHVIRRLPVKDEGKQIVLSEFEKNDLPPDGYSISVIPTGANSETSNF
jgi:hypothetical protein